MSFVTDVVQTDAFRNWRESNKPTSSGHGRCSQNWSNALALKTTPFDAAEYLDTPEAQAEFITAALETGDAAFIRDSVNTVARARGMSEIAKSTGLSREGLYKALGEAGNPEFSTMLGVLRALGLGLTARPLPKKSGKQRKPAKPRTRKAA
ncbi:putative addiction module antidote protein [Bradyrhizobium guangzhouense]|nr:putative addiction module antidote protein [Bradyrhizobium guangzhouense]